MTSITREEAVELFEEANKKKRQLNFIPKTFQESLHFMEYKIRKQTKSFTILSLCGGDRSNFSVDPGFQRTFQSMNFSQKVQYYNNSIEYASQCLKNSENPTMDPPTHQNINMTIDINKGYKWEESSIQLHDFKVLSDSNFNIDLRNYAMRVSKKKDRKCYVLQSIKKKVTPETIRFSFLSPYDHDRFFKLIKNRVNEAHRYVISNMINETLEQRKISKELISNPNSLRLKVSETKQQKQAQGDLQSPVNIQLKTPRMKTVMSQSICEEMVKDKDSQKFDDELEEMIDQQNQEAEAILKEANKGKIKHYKNVFKIIFPTYPLRDLSSLHHFKSIYQSSDSHLFIYHSVKNPQIYKMQMKVDLPLEIVCQVLYNFGLQKVWHSQISQGQIKMKISSENSCIGYLKLKALSEWYRERDYVFLMHLFKFKHGYYLVGKSIENTNFVPFQSIIRGTIKHVIWKISEIKNGCSIAMEINIDHGGLLNQNQKNQLTVRYLKCFQSMEMYFSAKQNQVKLTADLATYWQITEKQQNQYEDDLEVISEEPLTYRTCDFQESGSQIDEETVFYTINNIEDQEDQTFIDLQQEEQIPEVKPQEEEKNKKMMSSQLLNQTEQIIKLNEEGYVILPKQYLRKKQRMIPYDVQPNPIKMQYQSKNLVLKDDWIVLPKGRLKLVNKKKIQTQDSVFAFILSTLKKNLLSGKGALNISLPVYIFNIDSYLQRTCQALCMAPAFIQKSTKVKDSVERMKYCASFLLSNSIFHFDVEKPFNPILGETYQGYIKGCPVYAEQVSHHPPITAIYMIGRGYIIHGSLEGRVKIHMNSGEGINWGLYKIQYDDGGLIYYQTPPGELTGLTIGERGFGFKGKGYCLDVKNNLFLQLKFTSDQGFFSKKKWEFADQLEGELLKVTPAFMKKFLESRDKTPAKNDIQERYWSVGGRWPYQMTIDNEPFYKISEELPEKLMDEIFPLNSNSNYRQDLYYRKQNDLARSQIEKERLEVVQRSDRKWRQKLHGKSKH